MRSDKNLGGQIRSTAVKSTCEQVQNF